MQAANAYDNEPKLSLALIIGGIAVFGLAHIFLGAGIFQPYRGTHRLMFGDGTVSEADALYHWGHWARKELESGQKVIRK